MEKLKVSKSIYNNRFFCNNKCYLIFTFFNADLEVVELVRMILEDDYGLKIAKMEKSYNLNVIYLELELKDYIESKKDLHDFFSDENFKINLVGVYYKNNYLQISFFEDELLYELDSSEISDEILFYCYYNCLNKIIENNKIVFLFYNVIFLSKNLFYYNVYNTSSSF